MEPEVIADDIVNKVEQVYNNPHCDGGAMHAYEKFRDEFSSLERQGISAGDVKRTWAKVQEDLEERGILPEISVAWAQTNFAEVSGRGDKGNSNIDREDLAEYIRDNSYPETRLATALTRMYEDISSLSFNDGQGLSASDLNQFLTDRDAEFGITRCQ